MRQADALGEREVAEFRMVVFDDVEGDLDGGLGVAADRGGSAAERLDCTDLHSALGRSGSSEDEAECRSAEKSGDSGQFHGWLPLRTPLQGAGILLLLRIPAVESSDTVA